MELREISSKLDIPLTRDNIIINNIGWPEMISISRFISPEVILISRFDSPEIIRWLVSCSGAEPRVGVVIVALVKDEIKIIGNHNCHF